MLSFLVGAHTQQKQILQKRIKAEKRWQDLIISHFIHNVIITFIVQQEVLDYPIAKKSAIEVNYMCSLVFTVLANAKSATFQHRQETILMQSVPNWQSRSEQEPGLLL